MAGDITRTDSSYFMNMNNNIGTTPFTSSNKVVAKRVQKEAVDTEQERPRQEQTKEPKDVFVKSEKNDLQTTKTQTQKMKQVFQHFVSTTGLNEGAKDTEIKSNKKSQSTQQNAEETADGSSPKNVLMDNTSRIGLMFKEAQRKKQSDSGQVQQETSPKTQQNELKQMLSGMRKLVKNELNNYTTEDQELYPKRNLREILGALGEEVKAFDNKSKKDKAERRNSSGNVKAYNKYSASEALKHQKLFNEDSMQNPTFQSFEMIA